MSSRGPRTRDAGYALALIRLAAIPVFFAAERLVRHPAANDDAFEPLLILAALYAGAALVGELRGRPIGRPGLLACIDLLVVSALVATSGGPFSELSDAFFLLPVGAAALFGPRRTALASVAAVAAYLLIAVTYPGATRARPDAVGFELTQGLFLVWMGAAATLLSSILTGRTREVAQLAESRGRLVAEALDAEDIADGVTYMVTRPRHTAVGELWIMPTEQV